MQTVFMTRGEFWSTLRFIMEMQAKYLPMKYHGVDYQLQLSMRPIMLWEAAYPEEHHDIVCNTIFPASPYEVQNKIIKKVADVVYGPEWKYGHLRKFVWPIRKALRLDEVKYKIGGQVLAVKADGVERIALGQKTDMRYADGTEGV